MKDKLEEHLLPVMTVQWDQLAGCYDYVHLAGRFRLLDTHKRDSSDTIYGALEYPSTYREAQAWMCDLVIWSQGHNTDQPRKLYGWEPQYRVSTVNLREAERYAKTLRLIDRGLDRLKDEWGHPESYADYLLRVAKVLKVKYMAFKNTPERKERSGYEYQIRDVGYEARYSLDQMIRDWVEAGEREVAYA
jgi:hypothetical protein